ncbi:MAG: peptidylprolyl isomerase [Methylococcales bacterium]|nr:peptidylprolyl isomerase [Methylococcales bacterium]
MNIKLIPLVLVGATVLTACNSENSATKSVSKEDSVASVNGQYISKASLATLEKEIAKRRQGQAIPKDKLIEQLVLTQLLVQEATQKKLDKTDEFILNLELNKSSLLSEAAVKNYLKSNPVTDAELKAEYETTVAASGTEYKARHILVKTEEDAKQLIEELKSGSDFIELAKTKSIGPSAPQGGDLGWFAAGQMVVPFSEAVIALEDNKFTTEAIKTQFGWHVILREGSRSQTPPPFEALKAQLEPMLKGKKVQEFIDNLRTNAKVEIFLEKEPTEKIEAPKSSVDTATESVEVVIESVEKITDKPATEAVKTVKENLPSTTKEVTKAVTEEATDTTTKAIDSVTK